MKWEIWAGPGVALLIEESDPDRAFMTKVMSKRYMTFECDADRALEIFQRANMLERLGYIPTKEQLGQLRGTEKAEVTPPGDENESSEPNLRDEGGVPEVH